MQHPGISEIEKRGLPEDELYGIDACGSEVYEGDPIIEIDGEFVLQSNALQYLVEKLGAEPKVAKKTK